MEQEQEQEQEQDRNRGSSAEGSKLDRLAAAVVK